MTIYREQQKIQLVRRYKEDMAKKPHKKVDVIAFGNVEITPVVMVDPPASRFETQTDASQAPRTDRCTEKEENAQNATKALS